jgi:hypothetical protein
LTNISAPPKVQAGSAGEAIISQIGMGEKIKKPLTACMRTVSGPSLGDACPERLSGGQRNLE